MLQNILVAFGTIEWTTFFFFFCASAVLLFFSYRWKAGFARHLPKIFLIGIGYLIFTSVVFAFSLPVNWSLQILLALALLCIFYRLAKSAEISQIVANEAIPLPLLVGFGVFFASFYIGPLDGHMFSPDWSKNRSLLYSLIQNPFSPDLRGFGLQHHASLIYYYLPFHLPAILAKYSQNLLDLEIMSALKLAWIFVVLQSLLLTLWSLCFLPLFFKQIFKSSSLPPSFYGIFLFCLAIWGGADYWWRLFELKEEFQLGAHHDGVFDFIMQAQVHGIPSLMIWVPTQLTGSLCALAILAPFATNSRAWVAALALSLNIILGASAVSLAGLAVLLCLWLAMQWKSPWRVRFTDWLPLLVIVLAYYFFYSQKQFADDYHLLIRKKDDILPFFKQFFREYTFVLLLLSVAAYKKVFDRRLLLATSIGILVSFSIYYGIYNAWSLKAMIPITITLAYLAAVILSRLEKRWALALFTCFTFTAAPLTINEWLYALQSESAPFEDREFIIRPYVGRPLPQQKVSN